MKRADASLNAEFANSPDSEGESIGKKSTTHLE